MKKDLFDILEEEGKTDLFDTTESTEDDSVEKIRHEMQLLLEKYDNKDRKRENGRITSEMKTLIKSEIAKIKPVQNIIERQIEQVIKHEQIIKHEQVPVHIEPKIIKAPPHIIKEVRVEVQTPKLDDPRTFAEESTVNELKKEIESLKKELQQTKVMATMRGGSGVIGIPPPEPNPENYVLTINGDKKAQWKASTGGGLTAGTFSISNNTPNYTFDPTASTVDTLYQVVATLIRKLQGEI